MKAFYLPQWNAFLRYDALPGDGPARVYLPGLGASVSASFINVVTNPVLAGTQSLLIDFLGAGFSDRPTDFSYTIEAHALTIAALLDNAGIKNCTLIGHSQGGSVGIMLASLRPDLVSRLVVAEGNLDAGGGSFSKMVAAQPEQDFVQRGYGAVVEWLRAEAIKGDAGMAAFAGLFQMAAPYAVHRGAVSLVEGTQPSLRQRFYDLNIPRAYIYGERSVPAAPEAATPDAPYPDDLRREGIRVWIITNAGHGMMTDNPAGSATALKEFLGE